MKACHKCCHTYQSQGTNIKGNVLKIAGCYHANNKNVNIRMLANKNANILVC